MIHPLLGELLMYDTSYVNEDVLDAAYELDEKLKELEGLDPSDKQGVLVAQVKGLVSKLTWEIRHEIRRPSFEAGDCQACGHSR